MSERLSDAADSAEPASPRRASGDAPPPRPTSADERPDPVDGSPAAQPRRSAPGDGSPSQSAPPSRPADGSPRPSPDGTTAQRRSAPADGSPSQSGPPRSADGSPRQSPPAAGPPSRSFLADKARAAPAAGRPRRTAADVARAAESTRRTAGSDAPGGTDRRRESSAKAGREPKVPAADNAVERERPGGPWPMPERSLMATVLGVNPAAAVGVAAALTAVGVAVDLLRTGTLGTVFSVCYLAGCVLATAWVRRSGLFWPMVAPPLLMAVAVPVVVLVAGTPRPGAGIAQRLLVIGAPLVNGFPMMAWTTGLVLALGVFRLVTQRVNPGRGAARAGGRT